MRADPYNAAHLILGMTLVGLLASTIPVSHALAQDPGTVSPPGATPRPADDEADTRGLTARLIDLLLNGRAREAREALAKLVHDEAVSPTQLRDQAADLRFRALLLDHLARHLHGIRAQTNDQASGESIDALPWVKAHYRRAFDLFLEGDLLGAIRIADALAVLEPESLLHTDLQRLRQSAQERLVREHAVAVDVRLPAGGIPEDGPATVVLELRNTSDEVVEIRQGNDLNADLFGVLNVDYEELAPNGARRRHRRTHRVPTQGTIRLKPNETMSITVEIGEAHRRRGPEVFVRYRVSGRLRPQTLLRGDESLPYFLPIFARSLPLPATRYAPTDQHGALDTLRNVIVELAAGDITAPSQLEPRRELALRAFHAALMCPDADKEEVLGLLVAGVGKTNGAPQAVLLSTLTHVSGQSRVLGAADWTRWWQKRLEARDRALAKQRQRDKARGDHDATDSSTDEN